MNIDTTDDRLINLSQGALSLRLSERELRMGQGDRTRKSTLMNTQTNEED